MYGDDYKPHHSVRYKENEHFLSKATDREDLRTRVCMLLMDSQTPREDLHVLSKRECLKKGWKL
jgi:hypothetical protein